MLLLRTSFWVLSASLILTASLQAQQAPPQFLLKWGSFGSERGQFDEPVDVAVDGAGYVYVADTRNHRIQKFDGNGVFVAEWQSRCPGPIFNCFPKSVAASPSQDVYVLDGRSVQRFRSNGAFVSRWEVYGAAVDLDIDSSGRVFVFVNGVDSTKVLTFEADGVLRDSWGRRGHGVGEFWQPTGIAVDAQGMVYTVSNVSIGDVPHHVQKFDSGGNLLLAWGGCCSGDGEFDRPQDICVGPAGLVYVADGVGSRIQVFDANGEFITKWGSRCLLSSGDGCVGEGDGQFSPPQGVDVDAQGSVYVADRNNNRIQKFGVVTSVRRDSWGQIKNRYR